MSEAPQPASAKSQPASRPVDFVKKVGKGKTLSQNMTASESRVAFELLLDGAFLPAQFGAFLQALRIKELTQTELDALAGIFHARTVRLPPLAGRKTLVLNLASDTQRKGGLASLLAAHLLGRCGVGTGVVRSTPVLQGNRASFEDTWDLAGLLEPAAPAPSPDHAPLPVLADCAAVVPGLPALDDLRASLGFRSCLHTAEKLVNPWPASPLLLGISHKHYALRMASAMASAGQDGKILLGNHGTVDLVLHKETEIVSVTAGAIREEAVSPSDLGLEIPSDIYSLGKFPLWREWLTAPGAGRFAQGGEGLRDALQYHAAVLLWAAGAAADPAAGLAAARSAIPTLFQKETG